MQPFGRRKGENPVKTTARFAYKITNVVQINDSGIKAAAKHIRRQFLKESYTPRTWRTHPLHICPPEPYLASNSLNETFLNWIFLISSLNFGFWSEKAGSPERFGVEWREGWESEKNIVHTGYWSLVAALNRALADDDIPIIDPNFYSSQTLCPDSIIEHVFRPASQSEEKLPLMQQRIEIMREVGGILCEQFSGSFKHFVDEFQRRHDGQGTALELVQMVVDTFPCFRDEVLYKGRKVYLWKRAQILVAEMWAAFYPPDNDAVHPIFPSTRGPQIHKLSMFADYRVPQILHHLRIFTYPPHLVKMLHAGIPLAPGSKEELSLRSASILAVERVRHEIIRLIRAEPHEDDPPEEIISSVLIDFYLWDSAKKIEGGEKLEDIETAEIIPIHRTRSIWY